MFSERFPEQSSRQQHYENDATFFPGQSSQQQRYDNDTTFFPGQSYQQRPFDDNDTTFFANEIEEHDHAMEDDEGLEPEGLEEASETSFEDVDEGLEAEYNEGNAMRMHQPPCSIYMQDTWSNIVDPSPQMPNWSQVGWDGRSEFFVGRCCFLNI